MKHPATSLATSNSIIPYPTIRLHSQRLTGLEMGSTPLRNGDTFTTSRIASHPRVLALDRETTKPPDLYPVSTNQRIGHRVDDGIDSRLDITLCKLTKPSGKFSNQIGAVH